MLASILQYVFAFPDFRHSSKRAAHSSRKSPPATLSGLRPSQAQVLTSRDSPRTIWLVMIAKCVCMIAFQPNWKM
jgi:hypothetical protein